MQNDMNIQINPAFFDDVDDELCGFETDVVLVNKEARDLEIYQQLQPASGVCIVKPPRVPELSETVLAYEKAEAMAKQMDLRQGSFNYGYVSGEFIFGDFIEALFVTRNLHTKRLLIATLALSYENVDSLKNLLEGGYVDKLDLVYSDFQFSHERHGIVPYMYEQLGGYDFQLTVARSHAKLACFTTDNTGEPLSIGVRGSANLRSASCIEQIFVNESPQMNAIDEAVYDDLIERFATINRDNPKKAFNPRGLSRQKLWQYVKQSISKLTH